MVSSELCRLLAPNPDASKEEEQTRVSALMHHVISGSCFFEDVDFKNLDDDSADRLRAFQILQQVFGNSGTARSNEQIQSGPKVSSPVSVFEELPPSSPCSGAWQSGLNKSSAPAISDGTSSQITLNASKTSYLTEMHEIQVHFNSLPRLVRLLEAASSEEATQSYSSIGEKDPFGSKVWPASYVAASRLLEQGVVGCTVLELGCGTGLVSIAALLGGARMALATDLVLQNVERAQTSASLNGVNLFGEVFDVTSGEPLPSPTTSCKDPSKYFDFVVFSDVLYWEVEAAAFGRRAAEAYSQGSTVVVADPGRRREEFQRSFCEELSRRLQKDVHLPNLIFQKTEIPEHVYEWVSAEVRTASMLFCKDPFELVLRPPLPAEQIASCKRQEKVHSKLHFEIVD